MGIEGWYSYQKNDKNTTAYSFTGSPTENIRIYLTEKKSNAGAAVVSSKTLVKFGEEKLNQRTSALNGDVIDITAAREYILDTKVQLYGQWLP